jgi:hypothetical protein
MFDELRTAGVPVVEFSWSRKTKESQVTKLLLKRETSAARVFDRLRFRLIVRNAADLVPTLRILLHRCIPFNYVVPGQTVNTLIDLASLSVHEQDRLRHRGPDGRATGAANEFSGKSFQPAQLHRRPARPRRRARLPPRRADGQHRVVFVLAEFQIMDKGTAEANEQGENSHSAVQAPPAPARARAPAARARASPAEPHHPPASPRRRAQLDRLVRVIKRLDVPERAVADVQVHELARPASRNIKRSLRSHTHGALSARHLQELIESPSSEGWVWQCEGLVHWQWL